MELHNQALDEQYPFLKPLGFEGLIQLDAEGYIFSINEQAQLLLRLGEINNKKFHEAMTFYAEEDQRPIFSTELSFYSTFTTGKQHLDIIYGVKLDNDKFTWLSFSSKLISERPDMHTLIAIQDVSKLVNQNKDLIEKKQELQLLITSLDDLVFEVTRDGYFKNFWTSSPELLFYDPEHFLNKNIADLFPPEIAERTLKLILKALTCNKVYKMEFPSTFESHKDKWYRLKVKPIHLTKDRVALVISDISKKIESLEKIRFNQHKFNQAFHFSGLGISLTNLEGYCIEANKMLSKILGYSQKEISATNFFDYTHPEDIARDFQQRQKLIKGEIDSFTLEKRYRHKRGHYLWCSVTISAVHNQSNELSFFIVQLQDISEAKRNLEILERQKQELEIVKIDLETKVRQLEEFNQIVAHNLREPVSNIHMLIEGLKDENNTDDKNEYLELLKSSNDSLTDTLQELSQISEIRGTPIICKDECNFNTIFKKVNNQFLGEIHGKNALITSDFEVENICYPKLYLESILNNLLSNALKYTKPNSVPQIHLRTYVENNTTFFSITDNGIGIDLPKFKSQIFMFKKFFHRGFESKGIGLFITRYQVESMGGKIDVKSAPNEGTTFLIKFSTNN